MASRNFLIVELVVLGEEGDVSVEKAGGDFAAASETRHRTAGVRTGPAGGALWNGGN
ncbi:MAG: hypothetical protein HY243_15645 [Proteobacteria bacterium]|nr:hypothetical protein [Pseudomonadota bacterium]